MRDKRLEKITKINNIYLLQAKKCQEEKTSGITLIALVVTIVVLLILAGITINMLFSENGIITKAREAAEKTAQAEENDIKGMQNIVDEMDKLISGDNTSGGTGDADPKKVADNIGSVISETENTDLTDAYNNKITIPAGFYIVANGTDGVVYSYDKVDETSTGIPVVQDGIVIQNATDGNQFVWVPVGTIKNDSVENTTNTNTITLGRYSSFTKDSTTGLYTPVQTIENYTSTVTISSYYQEDTSVNHTKDNTIATDIGEFLTQANANGGYYIARYEASRNEIDNTKAASKSGQAVWDDITQPNAAIAAKATYPAPADEANKDDYNYYSDLINSYAWDTAIIFIQTYSEGNSTYASENKSTSFTTTGTNGDQVCNINDMSGNAKEWSTETYTWYNGFYYEPCTKCGGEFYMIASSYTSLRGRDTTGYDSSRLSFRLTLYVQ